MIELSANTACMVYLCLTIGIVLGIWGYHHYTSRRRKIVLVERELLVCEYCSYAYLEDLGKAVTQCPQCQSYNKSKDNKNKKA